MTYLSIADWIIIIAYLVGIILFGMWFGHGQRTTRDYFLGSRNIPWWGVGLSIVATETSALTFIGVPAQAYGGNLTFIQVVIGYVLARFVLAAVMVPYYFRGEIYSPYQLFGDAFGAPARRTVGAFFLISGTLAAGVRVYVTSIPIQLMLGVDITWAILLFVLLSLVYTYVGGIKAVVWTDAVQFLLFIAGGAFALVYIPSLLEGGWDAAMGAASEAGRLHWLNVQPPEGESWFRFIATMPYNLWMGVIGATIFVISSHGVDQLIVQRVLTCESVKDGRKALLLSAVIILPLMLMFLLIGAMLWVYFQQNQPGIEIPTDTEGFAKSDYVFPIFILTAVPPWLKGLLIVAILSAAMSSVSSALSALASVSTMDFAKGLFKRERSEDFYFRFSRHSTLAWAAILLVVAFASRQASSVLQLALSLSGLTNGAMLGGLILVLWWKRGRALPLIVGMVVSLVVMIAINFLPRVWAEGWNAAVGIVIAWPWYTLIGTVVTLVVACGCRMLEGSSAAEKSDEKR